MAEDHKKPTFPAEMTRRDLLDWVGRGAVLYLSAEVLSACGVVTSSGEDIRTGRDLLGSGPDAVAAGADIAEGDGEQATDAPTSPAEDFPFSPGDAGDDVFPAGTVRTVDTQDLAQLLKNWRLEVDGMVERPSVFTFGDLISLDRQNQITDFHCVEGWSVLDVPWNGLHIASLADIVKPRAGATHVTFHTVGGTYNESLPLDVAMEPKTLLTYGIAGETIPENRGFPLRLVVPRLWAYKSAKFVYRLEFTDEPVNGFWENYGYPYDAEVPADKLRDGKY